jgi:hypothetical protein
MAKEDPDPWDAPVSWRDLLGFNPLVRRIQRFNLLVMAVILFVVLIALLGTAR